MFRRKGTEVAQAYFSSFPLEFASMARILVAEDEHLTRWSVARTLRFARYEVDEARDGETAVKLLRTETYDAVVSDFRMPGVVNGLDVLTYYHALCPKNPVILITAQDQGVQKSLEALGGIYIRKPFFVEDLLAILEKRLLNH
jgi:DNA-binding NtrC family response regulator